MNLCTNAGHAMLPDGGDLTVRLQEVDLDAEYSDLHPEIEPGHYMQLTIVDSGKGIPAEFMDRIFDPFFTTKKRGEGTGMGLAMVHGIVVDHQGSIHVESTPDQGTAFTVHLPILEKAAINLTGHAEAVPQGDEHILVVDDGSSDDTSRRVQESGAELLRLGESSGLSIDELADEIERAGRKAADLCQQMLAYSGQGRFSAAPIPTWKQFIP